MNGKAKKGFTLIELLVVIAVIAMVAALLIPVLGGAKAKAQRTVCANNLRNLILGIRMYCDDANDRVPVPKFDLHASRTNLPWNAYKELMKGYVGLDGESSPKDRIFACPADTFHFVYGTHGYGVFVSQSRHDQGWSHYSSYQFNAVNLVPGFPPGKGFLGIGGCQLGSIRHPSRTVVVAEAPAYQPYSWHQPLKPHDMGGERFNNARDLLSFADGHVGFTRMYWSSTNPVESCCYEPPTDYDYQWSPN